MPLLAPDVVLAQRRVVLRFPRRGADLGGELIGQVPIALVDLGLHLRVEAELLGDALGAHGGLLVHPAWPDHPAEQRPPLAVAERGGLDGVLLLLAGHERPATGAADLPDRCGHGGAVHAVQLGQRGMRQPQPQVDQRDQEPVGEHQPPFGPSAGCPPAVPTAPLVERRLPERTSGRFLRATGRGVRGRCRTGQDGSRPYGPRSAPHLTQPVRPLVCHRPTGDYPRRTPVVTGARPAHRGSAGCASRPGCSRRDRSRRR